MTKETFNLLKTEINKNLLMLREEFHYTSEQAEINEENYTLMTNIQRLIGQINHQLLFIDSPDGEK